MTPRYVFPLASLLLASSFVAACGATDVETSPEYVELRDERDGMAAEVDDLQARLTELDDELTAANARLEEADAAAAVSAAVADDLDAFLVLDVMNRVGLDPEQSDCVGAAFVGDEELRRSYLLLLDQEAAGADGDAASAAFDAVTAAFEECGWEAPVEPTAEETAAAQAQLLEVLGDVEVAGASLPQFVEGSDPTLGTVAPIVTGADYDGQPVVIDAAADGPTMVVLLAHWCPHCNAEIPKLNQLRDEGKIPAGVNVVAVSSAVNPEAPNFPPDEWLADVDWTFPVLADGIDPESGSFVAYHAYGAAGVPFVVLLDGEGKVVQRWSGERDLAFLETALLTLETIG